MKYANDWERDWKENWLPLLLSDGELDVEKIKNEMHDLVFIFKQVSKVYDTITGGKLSKVMYFADTILEAHHENMQKSYDFGYEDGKEEGETQ